MKRGIIVLMVAVLLSALFAAGCETGKLSTEDLTKQVRASMEKFYAEKTDTAKIHVDDLTLIHKGGTQYAGVLKATNDGTPFTLAVEVTYDGKTFMWQTKLY